MIWIALAIIFLAFKPEIMNQVHRAKKILIRTYGRWQCR